MLWYLNILKESRKLHFDMVLLLEEEQPIERKKERQGKEEAHSLELQKAHPTTELYLCHKRWLCTASFGP